MNENDFKMINGVMYFNDFYNARDKAASLKGFPAASVVEHVAGNVVHYWPNGPAYPKLEEKPTDGAKFG